MGDSPDVVYYSQGAHRYLIDGGGTIWDGFPDDAQPFCRIKDLPIWKEHPQLESYRKIPLSCFFEQLDLIHEPAGSSEYTCFVCGGGQKHSLRKGTRHQKKRQKIDTIDLT